MRRSCDGKAALWKKYIDFKAAIEQGAQMPPADFVCFRRWAWLLTPDQLDETTKWIGASVAHMRDGIQRKMLTDKAEGSELGGDPADVQDETCALPAPSSSPSSSKPLERSLPVLSSLGAASKQQQEEAVVAKCIMASYIGKKAMMVT